MASAERRRGAICYNIQHLYTLKENYFDKYLKLRAGDTVTVLDDTGPKYWIVRRGDSIGRVKKRLLTPADGNVLQSNFINTRSQDRLFSAHHHVAHKLGPMPHSYRVIGYKVFEHSDKNVTIFFIQVKSAPMSVVPCSTTDDTWVVAKTQACFMRLKETLRRYLGDSGVPDIPDKASRRPRHWSVERWLQFRCEALQCFFDELRSRKRGLLTFPLGSTAIRMRCSEGTAHPSVNHILDDPRIKRSASMSSAAEEEEFTLEDTFSSAPDSALDMGGVDGTMGFTNPASRFAVRKAEPMLIDGLIPLNFFLRTDIVELVPGSDTLAQYVSSVSVESKDAKGGRTVSTEWPETDSNSASDQERWSVTIAGRNIEPMPFCPHLASDYSFRENRPVEDLLKVFPPFPRAQEEHEAQSDDIPLDVLAAAVRRGDFEISADTPITSLLRVWAVAGGDRPEDHRESAGGDIEMEGGGDAEAAESAGEEEDDSEDDEDETPPSGYFELQRTRCTAYPFRAANASVAALGADGRLHELLSLYASRRSVDADAKDGAADLVKKKRRASGSSTIPLGEPACAVAPSTASPFADTHKFIRRINSTLSTLPTYMKDRKDSRAGLNAFAQFSLSSLVAIIKKHAAEAEKKSNIAPLHMSASARSTNFYDAGSDAIISGLNDKIQTLSLNWERRRMEEKQREQDALEGEGGGKSPRAKSVDTATKIGHFYYEVTAAGGEPEFRPFPSQFGHLEVYSATALSKWLAMRAKSRLSRKSERTARLERMQKLETTFQDVRVTCEQVVSIMAVVDQEDEKQHAMYTLISKLTDVIEADDFRLWGLFEIHSDLEKKSRLVVSALACEAVAEQHCKEILDLQEICDKHISISKSISTKIPRSFGSPGWKESDIGVPPTKSRVNELRQDVQTLRRLVGEIRVHVESGASHVTGAVQEQTEAAKYTQELKKLVVKAQQAAKMKGALTAGKPEYLVYMKLKNAMMVTERARTLSAQAVDEIAAAYTSLKKALAELEETLSGAAEFTMYLQRLMLSASSQDDENQADDGVDNFLDDAGVGFRDPLLDAGGGGARGTLTSGWRREMKEIFTDNYFKFKKAAGVDNDDPEEDIGANELGRMCLLISRIPLLRDTHTAMEEWNKREDEMNNADEEGDGAEDGGISGEEEDPEDDDDTGGAEGQGQAGEEEAKKTAAEAAHRRGMMMNQRSLASRRLLDDDDNMEMY